MVVDPSAAPDSARPRVTVVVPVFNKASFVAETLSSVLCQTYSQIELIVVDDGSTDGSASVVRERMGDLPFRLIELTNGGVSRARNAGAAAASAGSQYLIFLDADDLLAPDAVQQLVRHLDNHPEAAACYCRLRYVDASGSVLADVPDDRRWAWSPLGRRTIADESPDTPLEAVWSRFWAIPSCFLIRRRAYEGADGWQSELCPPRTVFGAEDKDMAIQLALQGEIHRVPQRLVDYRVLPSSRKDALYEGLRALDVKWWSAGLSRASRSRIRRAIRFDARVAAFDAVGAAGRAARGFDRGELRRAVVKAGRALARWMLTGYRMERWAREEPSGGTPRVSSPAGSKVKLA